MGKMHFWKWLPAAGLAVALAVLPAAVPVTAEASAKTMIATSNGAAVDGFEVSMTQTRYPYRGGGRVLPKFTVRYEGRKLVDGKDYRWWTVNAKRVGDATLVIKGLGKYSGQIRTTYKIVRRVAKYVTAKTRYGTYYYKGKARKPAIEASYVVSGKTVKLKKGRDYTVTYKNNVLPGTSTAIVKLRGNYSGTVKVKFRITVKGQATPTMAPKPTASPWPAKTPTTVPSPTAVPTPTNTPAPTGTVPHVPTKAPTRTPTAAPTKAPTSTPTKAPAAHVHHWVEKTEVVHHDGEGHWHYITMPPQEPSPQLIALAAKEDEDGEPLGHTVKRIKWICNLCGFITPDCLECGEDHVDPAHEIGRWRNDWAIVGVCFWDKYWVTTSLPCDETVVTGLVCTGCGAEISRRPATKQHEHEWQPITNTIFHEAQGYFEDYAQKKELSSLVAPEWKYVADHKQYQDYIDAAGTRIIGDDGCIYKYPVLESREFCTCGYIFPADISEGSEGAAEIAAHEAEGHRHYPSYAQLDAYGESRSYDCTHDNPVWGTREVCSCGYVFPEDVSEGSEGAAEVAAHEAEGHTHAPKKLVTHFDRWKTRFVVTEPEYMEENVVTAYQCKHCGAIQYPDGFDGSDANFTVHCYQEDKSGHGFPALMY